MKSRFLFVILFISFAMGANSQNETSPQYFIGAHVSPTLHITD